MNNLLKPSFFLFIVYFKYYLTGLLIFFLDKFFIKILSSRIQNKILKLHKNITFQSRKSLPTFVSIATTPARFEKFIRYSLPYLAKYKNINFIINISHKYKRFNSEINFDLVNKIKSQNNIYFHWTQDVGPITKYIGGKEFLDSKKISGNLIICDDDIYYDDYFFYRLIHLSNNKPFETLITGSIYLNSRNTLPFYRVINLVKIYSTIALNNYSLTYKNKEKTDYLVEGFKGIYFNSKIIENNPIIGFISYYKTINFNSEDCINKFLCNCFLADDFVISYFFKHCSFIEDLTMRYFPKKSNNKLFSSFNYENGNDAIHNTTNGNSERYDFLKKNQIIFEVFCNKINLNKELNLKVLKCKRH